MSPRLVAAILCFKLISLLLVRQILLLPDHGCIYLFIYLLLLYVEVHRIVGVGRSQLPRTTGNSECTYLNLVFGLVLLFPCHLRALKASLEYQRPVPSFVAQ